MPSLPPLMNPGPADGRRSLSGGPALSVCVTTRGRPGLLDGCLQSLKAQADAPAFELLVCCQGDPEAAAVVRSHFPDATIGLVEHAHPGGARNFLIERARSDLLLFLDDDVTFPDSLVRDVVSLAASRPEVGVFGGPNLTPPDSSLFQYVSGAVLGSVVGTGPVRRRYARHSAGPADERFFTLCNMAVRADVMESFPPTLSGGEENAVLHAMAVRRIAMHYDPDLIVYHERRPTFGAFARQMEKYGCGRGQVMARRPGSTTPAHCLPLVFLAWLVSLPVVAVLWSPWYLLSAALYGVALLAAGVAVAVGFEKLSAVRRAGVVLVAAGLTATVHACYGVGVLRGLLRRRRTPASVWQHLSGPDLLASGSLTTDQVA